jgi:CBS domain-containing protein
MTVAEVMSPDVKHVLPETPTADAKALMRRERIHHLAVIKGKDLLGIVSARDLSRGSAGKKSTVADAMERHVIAVEPTATTARVAQLMRGRSIGCVIVRERGRVVGIVTIADLLGKLGAGRRRHDRATSGDAIHNRVPHRHRHSGDGTW